MTKQDLNTKWWYRLIKALFLISFVLVQVLSLLWVVAMTAGDQVRELDTSDVTALVGAGDEIKKVFPEYNDIPSAELARRVYADGPGLPTTLFIEIQNLRARGFSEYEIQGINDRFREIGNSLQYNTRYENEYSGLERVGLILLSLVSVSILFWLISRFFFYVVTGEKFFSKPFVKP